MQNYEINLQTTAFYSCFYVFHIIERMISLYGYPYFLHLKPRVESITDEGQESNCSMIEKIPPKGVSFSDFIATFAMSYQSFACF